MKSIPVNGEKRCPVCMDDWDEFDGEGKLIPNAEGLSFEESGEKAGQRLAFLCKTVGHVLHNRCIERLEPADGCPVCKASAQPKYFPHRKVNKAELEDAYKKELSDKEIQRKTSSSGSKEAEEGPEK